MKLWIIKLVVISSILFLISCIAKPSSEEINHRVPVNEIITSLPDSLITNIENRNLDTELEDSLKKNKVLWKQWINSGLDVKDTFTIDFYYYATKESHALKLCEKLKSYGLVTKTFPETTLLILKGWKIKTQIRRIWDLNTLQTYSKVLYFAGKETGPFLEGKGALIE